MYTPWGQSDYTNKIAEGIVEVGTPSHGGIWLSTKRIAQLPKGIDNFTHDLKFWEEDCDWVVPYIVFAKDIQAYGKAYKFSENFATACDIARRFHPKLMGVEP